MDIQLQELLDTIKKDGVTVARDQSAKLIAEAEEKAKKILADADREAKALRDSAQAAAARNIEAGNAALVQAARDLMLSLRDRIQGLLESAVRTEASAAMTPALLREVLPEVLKKSFQAGSGDLSVQLPADVLARLDSGFAASLAAELKKGVELKPFSGSGAGFRIMEKNGAVYYDFSAEALAELLAKRLNARLAESVRGAVKRA